MTLALRKYFDAVLLIAVLPVALVLGWQVWAGIRAEQDRIEDELSRAAAAVAQSTDRELASTIEALTVLSQSELFQQGRIAAMGRLLHGRPRRDWDSVFLLDGGTGAVVLDTAVHGPSIPPDAMRALHAQVLRKRGAVVSGPTSSPGIAIATPIVQGGRVRYVLGVRTSDGVWTRVPSSAPVPPDGEARLYDADGRPITPAANGAADDNDAYEAWATVPLSGWRARVSVPAGPIDAAHRRTIVAALSTSGASLVLGLALAAFVARRIARRIADEARIQDERNAQLIHRMRNHLNAIGAAVDVLATDPAPDAAGEAREVIARQTRELAGLIHDHERPPPAP